MLSSSIHSTVKSCATLETFGFTCPRIIQGRGLLTIPSLVVLFDGYPYLNLIPGSVILDNLIAAGKIPPTVGVFISQRDREKEMAPNTAFNDFVVSELIPWTRANYNVTHAPKFTAIGGSSLGGLMAAYAGLRHPEIFGKIIAQSGSFWWSPVPNIRTLPDARVERGWITRGEFLEGTKAAADLLASKPDSSRVDQTPARRLEALRNRAAISATYCWRKATKCITTNSRAGMTI